MRKVKLLKAWTITLTLRSAEFGLFSAVWLHKALILVTEAIQNEISLMRNVIRLRGVG